MTTPNVCPFCGNVVDLRVSGRNAFTVDGETEIIWHVRCVECGANGPDDRDEFDAVLKWNKAPRHTSADLRSYQWADSVNAVEVEG
jgi:hypothetical protein